MKKQLLSTTILTLCISFSVLVYGQNNCVLVEEVTSASCGPCASQNPAFNALLLGTNTNVAIIKYQRGGGNYIDPMWDFNPSETDSRITGFYNITSFPHVWINGVDELYPSSVNQAMLDQYAAIAPKFDIQVTRSLNSTDDTLIISATFTALQDFQDPSDITIRGFVIVVEEEVNYSVAPGTNGEKDFSNVMRKMLPSNTGALIGKLNTSQQKVFTYEYAIDKTEIDPQELKVVAFVQKTFTKDVYGSIMTTKVSTPAVGIQQPISNEDFHIYPSPASNDLNFRSEDATLKTIAIRDITGRVLSKYSASGSLTKVDVSAIPEGIYFATFTSEKGISSKRFVIAR